jgi:hypothetical protein
MTWSVVGGFPFFLYKHLFEGNKTPTSKKKFKFHIPTVRYKRKRGLVLDRYWLASLEAQKKNS